MKDWSTEQFQCKWCLQLFRGYVPARGDGTGFLLPRHKNQEGQRCQGSGQMYNVRDSKHREGQQ